MANAPFKRESAHRASNDAFKPVVVNTLNEIKFIISEMLNRKDSNQSINVKANLKWTEESIQKTSEITTISEDVSLFKLLVDGMEHVKKWMELLDTTRKATQKVNEEEEGDIPPHVLQVWNIDRMKFNVDSLIKNRFGGVRNGLRVRWKVQDGIFEFDPFTTKFFEVTDDKAEDLP
jgi:hypothetical protein